MILFCDTSALMKLYAQEEHSAAMRQQVEQAGTSLLVMGLQLVQI